MKTPDRQKGFLYLAAFLRYEALSPRVSLRAAGGDRLHCRVLVQPFDLTPKSHFLLFHFPHLYCLQQGTAYFGPAGAGGGAGRRLEPPGRTEGPAEGSAQPRAAGAGGRGRAGGGGDAAGGPGLPRTVPVAAARRGGPGPAGEGRPRPRASATRPVTPLPASRRHQRRQRPLRRSGQGAGPAGAGAG